MVLESSEPKENDKILKKNNFFKILGGFGPLKNFDFFQIFIIFFGL